MDRTTKLLLFAIALGLWMHVAGDWLKPVPVQAQGVESTLMQIQLEVMKIGGGTCQNRTICPR